MSRTKTTHIWYCSFPPPVPTNKYYTCYGKEVCCTQGCCINGPFQIYHVWYYWLLFLVVFAIISGGSWLCKKTPSRPRRTAATLAHGSCGYPVAHCSRRRCAANSDGAPDTRRYEDGSWAEYEDDIILDQLYVSFRNRSALGDPPSYSSILTRDCSNKPSRFCPLYAYSGAASLSDPPPAYSSMYVLSPGALQVEQPCLMNSNVIVDELSASSGNVNHPQVHPEEDVVVVHSGSGRSDGNSLVNNTTKNNVGSNDGGRDVNNSTNNQGSASSTTITDGITITQEGRANQIDSSRKQEDV